MILLTTGSEYMEQERNNENNLITKIQCSNTCIISSYMYKFFQPSSYSFHFINVKLMDVM